MVTIGEKFVERVEKAVVETLVLSEVKKQPNLSLDQIVTRVRGVGGFDEKVDRAFVESAVKRLDRDGHVKGTESKYTITDDGREDLQKIETIFRNVSNEFLSTSGTMGRTGTTPGAMGATGTGTIGSRNP